MQTYTKRLLEQLNYKLSYHICHQYYTKKAKTNAYQFYCNPKNISYLLLRLIIAPFVSQQIDGHTNDSVNLKTKLKGLVGLNYFKTTNLHQDDVKLYSIAENFSFADKSAAEITIIIKNCSTVKQTAASLLALKKNETNTHPFCVSLQACTEDVATAFQNLRNVDISINRTLSECMSTVRTPFVCLLESGTTICHGSLEALLNTLKEEQDNGLVCGKTLTPDGLLSNAAMLLFKNGEVQPYGYMGDPNYFAYNFKREADLADGTFLLLRNEDCAKLVDLKSLETITDLSLSIRHKLHKKVIYQPLAVAVKHSNTHYLTNSIDQKWKGYLTYYANPNNLAQSVCRYNRNKTIAIIDLYPPRFDKESGSHRIYELLKIFKDLKYNIIFIADNGKPEQPYYNMLIGSGIAMPTKYAGKKSFYKDVEKCLAHADIIWACRPKLNKRYRFLRKSNKKALWIYDTVDLHYVRLEREASLLKSPSLHRKALRYKKLEIALAKQADTTICITEVEANELQLAQVTNTVVIPNIHALPVAKNVKPFNQRQDILFVGSYDHTPNVDAVIWLCNTIMPIVWKTDPAIKIHLVGNNPKANVLALANSNVIVHGYVENLNPFYEGAKLFVAPLRYGAGMKGKIGQSLSFSVPTITTSIGAEGMNLIHGKNVLITNTATAFANAIIDTYHNQELWTSLSNESSLAIQQFTPETVTTKVKQLLPL